METLLMVEDGHVNQCLHQTNTQRCRYLSITGERYCNGHIHLYNAKYSKKNEDKRYNLRLYRDKANSLAKEENFHSTRDEIVLLRILLDRYLNLAQTEFDLVVYGAQISKTIEALSALCATSVKIEKLTGQSIDKQSLSIFAEELITIIKDEVKDEEVLKRLSERVGKSLEQCFERSKTEADDRA